MKNQNLVKYSILLCGIWLLPFFGKAQDCGPLTRVKLREKLVELGYVIKDLNITPGEEKYEVVTRKGGYNIPVSYEISPSTNYIWIIANLGTAKTDDGEKNLALLKQNSKIQPCQFYITDKGNLMMGLAVENRGVTNAILQRHSEKILTDVADSDSYWNK